MDNLVNTLTQTILDTIYPIGSLYTSFNNTNPASIIGGTWTQITDCFLMAAGSSYAIGTSGGSISHTHDYGLQFGAYYRDISLESNANAGVYTYDISNNRTLGTNAKVGSYTAQINNNSTNGYKEVSMSHYGTTGNVSYTSSLPPYKTIYMWQRIA